MADPPRFEHGLQAPQAHVISRLHYGSSAFSTRDPVFLKAKMNLSNFQGSKLDGADLRGIRGRYAIWRNANWWDARMNDDLRKALTKKWPREDE